MKYIVVSGGVISGIGKGVIASSTGLLLKTLGLRVTAIKVDPYMNIDAGTMSPTEHGEVYVLDDGGEADLDLGNYERYLDVTLSRDNNITTGKIYREVIEKERKGDYLGKTVQIVPHLTNAIQDWIERVAQRPVDGSGESPEVCIIELGGTVGDIESAPFVEAMRQFQFRVGHDNFALIHVSLVPVIGGEQKTKPTQAAIRDLRGLGLVPDMIAARCPVPLEPAVINKLSMFCHVGPEQVMAVHDVSSTYHVPLLLEEQGMVRFFQKRLGLDVNGTIARPMKEKGHELRTRWRELTVGHDRMIDKVEIVLVGRYIDTEVEVDTSAEDPDSEGNTRQRFGRAQASFSLFDGAIDHRDSIGTFSTIHPGTVNLMTAGRGIVHSERSPLAEREKGPGLYGMQTWLALPDGKEEIDPAFEAVSDLPWIDDNGARAQVIMGELWGERSPTTCHAETIYAEILLQEGGSIPIDAEADERAVMLVGGDATIDGLPLTLYDLVVLKPGAAMQLASRSGGGLCHQAPRLVELRQLRPGAYQSGQGRLAPRPLCEGAGGRGGVDTAARWPTKDSQLSVGQEAG